eukprot:scaffold265734_cov37-Tisochrysis_lutea.AAC.1
MVSTPGRGFLRLRDASPCKNQHFFHRHEFEFMLRRVSPCCIPTVHAKENFLIIFSPQGQGTIKCGAPARQEASSRAHAVLPSYKAR